LNFIKDAIYIHSEQVRGQDTALPYSTTEYSSSKRCTANLFLDVLQPFETEFLLTRLKQQLLETTHAISSHFCFTFGEHLTSSKGRIKH